MSSEMLYQKYALTQSLALKMLEAVTNKADELGIRINAAVVDDGGNLKAFIRMDEAALLSSEIAQNKAYTAAAFGKSTEDWYPMIKEEPALLAGIVHTNRLVVFGGGVPLICNGKIVGGVGVSGGSAEEDVQCATAGLEVFEEYVKTLA